MTLSLLQEEYQTPGLSTPYKRMSWTTPKGVYKPCPPSCSSRQLKCSSLSSSSFSSSTSHSSSQSSSSSSSLPFFSPSSSFFIPPSEEKEKGDVPTSSTDDQVYVTSSSTIILVTDNDDNNVYDPAYECSYYNGSNFSSYGTPSECQSARMRSIFYEDVSECQEISCFVEGSEGDPERESPGHYESIYEVIDPADPGQFDDDVPKEGSDHPLDGDVSDDSFDSDESDDAYSTLHPTVSELKTLSLPHNSEVSGPFSLDPELEEKYLRRKYRRSISHQNQGITKIAEVANQGMKKLRRNWTEVRTGLNKMKRKTALSMGDFKSIEDIRDDSGTRISESDKSRWSTISSRFRRKHATILPSPNSIPDNAIQSDLNLEDKNNATFYLGLSQYSDSHSTDGDTEKNEYIVHRIADCPSRRKSLSSSISSIDIGQCVNGLSRPRSTLGLSLCRNTSLGSNSGTLFRPANPPPAPPTAGEESSDNSDMEEEFLKDTLASRLNQILLTGPVAPPGRKVLKASNSRGSNPDVSPTGSIPSEEEKKSSPGMRSAVSLRQLYTSEMSLSGLMMTPRNRSSISSSGSSEGYIRPKDLFASPPPLPARPVFSQSSKTPKLSTPLLKSSNSLSRLPETQNDEDSPDISSDDQKFTNGLDSFGEEPHGVSSQFLDEPLYQFYTAKVERAALYQGSLSSEDDYEVINDGNVTEDVVPNNGRPSAMELVTPADGRRTLWCELPEVVNSGILDTITNQEKKIQEAMFEVITSEASYLKSLNVLVSHFMYCPEFTGESSVEEPRVITKRDRNILFSDILAVKMCSERLLKDLEKSWQESFLIKGISSIIQKHASSSFNVYVKYCSNQIYQDRKLRDLKEKNSRFVEVLTRLEASPICQSLSMQSFLMLPMQRVTRLPLLIDAIFNRLEYGSTEWEECKLVLATLQQIVKECNEAARKMERMEEMLLVYRQLDFREVKSIPLISASRWLVKKGELTRLTSREGDAKVTFGRKISKHVLFFYLFTDLLVVTKKKSEDQYTVLDYCLRNMVQVMELENADNGNGTSRRILDGHKNLILMTMLQNHENKTLEMVLSCPSESERSRWVEAVTPRTSENPDERIYEEWDCPQVQVIHSYVAEQPDEISLDVSVVFNVLKKTSDGWYHGERLRDGARGWFPGNHTTEIKSAHVRARHLRERYRWLAVSSAIVDEQQKVKVKTQKEEKKKERRRTITLKESV